MAECAYRFGDIVKVDIPDPDGNPCQDEHFAMIVRGPTSDGRAVVLGITSKFDPAVKHLTIEMPWAVNGHPTTGLYMDCRMKCWWAVPIHIRDIRDRIGTCTVEIARKAEEYLVTAIEEKRVRRASQ